VWITLLESSVEDVKDLIKFSDIFVLFSNKVPYRPAVEVTSMSYLPNTQIESYLGNINLFLIRESHTVREVRKRLNNNL